MDKRNELEEHRTGMTVRERRWRDHRLRARLGKGRGQREWQVGEKKGG